MPESMPELKKPTLTDRQRRSLHLWLTRLADQLNLAGLDQRKVLKPSVSIPWTQEAAKEQLWRPIQQAMFEKRSTTELSKTEVGKVEEVLARHLAERFGIEVPVWPHYENEEEYVLDSLSTDSS